jgi:4-amino-4-deoxy-L-arabinose transferase-like glycosyltransferase
VVIAMPYTQDNIKPDIRSTVPIVPPTLMVLVLVVVLVRIALSFALPRVVKWDEPIYLLLGHNLLAGNGFTWSSYPELTFPPLYPIVAGFFHLIIGDFEKASNLAYAVFGGLMLLPVFVLARRIYGRQTAWLAVVLLALFPALDINVLYWGSMTEPLYLFLIYGGLAALLAGLERHRLGMFTAAGVLFGLAYLTRPEAIVYVGLFCILAFGWLGKDLGFTAFRTWSAVGIFALSFMVLAIPYMWYLHAHTGQWMVSGKINISWKQGGSGELKNYDKLTNGLDSSGTEIIWLSKDRFQGNTMQTALADPADLLGRVLAGARSFKDQFFERTHFWGGLTPLVILGLFKHSWDRRRLRHEAFLTTVIVGLLVIFIPFGVLIRYFAPAFPVLLMWTARGALILGVWLQDTVNLCRSSSISISDGPRTIVLGWLPAGIVVGFLLLTIPVAAQGWIDATFFGDKEAGLWLKAHTPADARVMAQDLGIALYADRRFVPSPNADATRFMKYAHAHKADYLVVRNYKLAEYRPQLASLLEKGTPNLALLASFVEPHMEGQIKTLIYHISPALN